MSEKPLKQEQILEQRPITKRSRDILLSYLGKQVVLEVGDVGNLVCSGFLNKYDGRFLQITDFKQHKHIFEDYIRYVGKGGVERDINSEKEVSYTFPTRNIAVCLVASIQTLEDILNTKPNQ